MGDTLFGMSMFRLDNRCALVIGGLGGLGRGISATLIEAGAHVIAMDISAENEASFRKVLGEKEAELTTIYADATEPTAYERAIESAVRRGLWIDTVVICATPAQFTKPIEEYKWKYHEDLIDVFVKIPYVATTALLDSMKKHHFGRIINITSEVFETGEPLSSAYVAAKGAQIGWTRSMSKELAPFGITVNHVAPGFIPVERHKDLPQEVLDGYLANVPSGTWGTPQDVGASCVFFASTEAGYVTGQTLLVTGGRTPH